MQIAADLMVDENRDLNKSTNLQAYEIDRYLHISMAKLTIFLMIGNRGSS